MIAQLVLLALTGTLGLFSGPEEPAAGERQGSSAASAAKAAAPGVGIEVVDSDYGPVVAVGSGEAVYVFGRERTAKPRCYGACAEAWPPVLSRGAPVARSGADATLLGTSRRAGGGLQVTYAGQPLYFYVGDSPGAILCQDVVEFGGRWLVLAPDGEAVG